VEEGLPASDLIWSDLNKATNQTLWQRFGVQLLVPLILAAFLIYAVVTVDQEVVSHLLTNGSSTLLLLTLKYVSPILLCVLAFYLIPKFLFNHTLRSESHELRSEKEKSFMRKAVTYMILTSLIIPVVICMTIAWDHLVSFENDRISEETTRIREMGPVKKPSVVGLYAGTVDNAWNEFVAVILSKSHEYFIRIGLQLLFLIGIF